MHCSDRPKSSSQPGESARQEIEGLTEADVREALERCDPLWDELFPTEQARIVALLVHRIDVAGDGIDVRLRIAGLASVFQNLAKPNQKAA